MQENSSPHKQNAEDDIISEISNPKISLGVYLESESMRLNDMQNIACGEIIILKQSLDQEVAIVQNGRVVGMAKLIGVDGKFAMQIQALSGDSA